MFPSRKITSGLRSLYSFLTNGKQLMLAPLRFVARNNQKSEDLAGRTMPEKKCRQGGLQVKAHLAVLAGCLFAGELWAAGPLLPIQRITSCPCPMPLASEKLHFACLKNLNTCPQFFSYSIRGTFRHPKSQTLLYAFCG